MSVNGVEELAEICPVAAPMSEAGSDFVYLPKLRIQTGPDVVERDALLSLCAHSGYTSRLYLSSPIPSKGQNWTTHTVLGRSWHTPSWMRPTACSSTRR